MLEAPWKGGWKEVYLFDAAASRRYAGSKSSVLPPLVSDCFKVFNDLDVAIRQFVRIGHIVNHVRDTRRITVLDFRGWNEDIESFPSAVAHSIDCETQKGDCVEALTLNTVCDQTACLFWAILYAIQNGRVPTTYQRLVRRLDRGDFTVKFKWDCLLGLAL